MKVVLRGAQVYTASGFSHRDVLIDDGVIADIAPFIPFCRDIVSFDFLRSFFSRVSWMCMCISESRDLLIKKR